MGDLLSAASLLLAVVAVLYGLWYGEITAALNTDPPELPANRAKPRRLVTTVLCTRAVPLAVASSMLSLIFLPDAVMIVIDAGKAISERGIGGATYDAVRMSFVVVLGFIVSIALHSITRVCRLWFLRRRLNP